VNAAPTKGVAPAAAAPEAGSIRAEGRLATYPGGSVTISTEVAGRIVRLPVEEGMRVRRGELLLDLDCDEERAALTEARAQLAAAVAALQLAESDVERNSRLATAQVVSEQGLDRIVKERDAARARRDAARATVQRLAARLAKMRITSPLSGQVITRQAQPGETVSPGAPLLAIADLDRTRVEAEVDEFDVARLRVGASVIISAEGYAQTWRGRVEEIPAAVTSRRLKPQDPGRPSDTRVLIVKVALEEPVPLKLGQRVEVEIEGGS
jgi:HlyD family secretion protein